MKITNVLSGMWQSSIPIMVYTGQRVVATAPVGSVFCRRDTGTNEWSVVSSTDVKHSGDPAEYRVVGASDATVSVALEIT